jgi:cbb3-type cytochrome oxidase cytochrome c subunit
MATNKTTPTKAKNDKIATPAKAPAPVVPAPAVKAVPAKAAAPAKAKATSLPSETEIKTRAYEIYVSEGCQDGHDQEYWLRAEAELRTQASR